MISISEYFLFCVAGRVTLFVLQKASHPYLKFIKNKSLRDFLTELFGCDLCLGVWIYVISAVLLNVNVIYEISNVPVIPEIITGVVTSFLVYVLRNGWDVLFKEFRVN